MQQQSTGKTPRNAPSALWRERVIAVGVALTDAAITALDKHLAALVLGDIQSASTRLLLCAMDGRQALTALATHTPLFTAADGDNPLVLSAHFKNSKSCKTQAIGFDAGLDASDGGCLDQVISLLALQHAASRTGRRVVAFSQARGRQRVGLRALVYPCPST